jgi:hypothetical protein
MSSCSRCGGEIIFRRNGSGVIPIHLSGGCGRGWSSGGDPGGTSHDYYAEYFQDYRWGLFPSYVNPNANCPVCGAAVYFYQSPFGGRVFFDDLGPPWPKHACTDSSQSRTPRPRIHRVAASADLAEIHRPVSTSMPRWFADGWRPFVSDTAKVEGAKLILNGYVLEGTARKQIRITYSMESNRYYEMVASGVSVGINFLMNSGRVVDALREGLVMLRYKSETSVEIDLLSMTHLHEIKRFSIE